MHILRWFASDYATSEIVASEYDELSDTYERLGFEVNPESAVDPLLGPNTFRIIVAQDITHLSKLSPEYLNNLTIQMAGRDQDSGEWWATVQLDGREIKLEFGPEAVQFEYTLQHQLALVPTSNPERWAEATIAYGPDWERAKQDAQQYAYNQNIENTDLRLEYYSLYFRDGIAIPTVISRQTARDFLRHLAHWNDLNTSIASGVQAIVPGPRARAFRAGTDAFSLFRAAGRYGSSARNRARLMRLHDPVIRESYAVFAQVRNRVFADGVLERVALVDIARESTMRKLQRRIESNRDLDSFLDKLVGAYNKLRDHLKPQDLTGMVRDKLGRPVVINVRSYQHLTEVREARAGLVSVKEAIQRKLNSGSTPDPQSLRALINDLNRVILRIGDLDAYV